MQSAITIVAHQNGALDKNVFNESNQISGLKDPTLSVRKNENGRTYRKS